jgi:hypothetical protein
MTSSIFKAILKEKAESPPTGGRGVKNPSKFIRLSEDALEHFDHLRAATRGSIAEFPLSPRNKRLTEFLDLLDECFPTD